jgi:periplasmic protein TonB
MQVTNSRLFSRAVVRDATPLKWMIFLSILSHIVIIYGVFPGLNTNIPLIPKDRQDVINLTPFHPVEPPELPPREVTGRHPVDQYVPYAVPVTAFDPVPVIPDNFVADIPNPDEMMFDPPESPSHVIYSLSQNIEAPTVKWSIQPVYPAAVRRIGLEGMVVLEAVITRDGNVSDIRIAKSLHSFCDQAAVQAVRQWRFNPGLMNGIPVDVRMHLTVSFRLK